MPVSRTSSFGFTLIELSVVLVIIGLLLGAVVGGQAMIRSAELQSIVSDYTRYKDAVVTFKKQYQSTPGDMVDALDFWGQSTVCSGASATGTCNGDGDGIIESGSGANATGETFQFWRQLALAGRIVGTYSGASGATNATNSEVGVNVPSARITGSGWDVGGQGTALGSVYTLTYGNYLRVGLEHPTSQVIDPILTPEEAWKLDTKLDDGMPGRGTIIASRPINQCATAGNATDFTAPYNLTVTTQECGLFFIQQF